MSRPAVIWICEGKKNRAVFKMVRVLRNRKEILYFVHFSSSRAVFPYLWTKESRLLTVILETHKRISNMLSTWLCNAVLGLKCLHTCNLFIFSHQSSGSSWGGRGRKGSVRPQNKDWDLGEWPAIGHLMALVCPVRAPNFIYLLILYSWHHGFKQICGALGT